MFMTVQEHRDVYMVVAESVIADPEPVEGGLDRRVLKGAEFLDKTHPGWADKINLDLFDIRSGSHCVIGQVFGEYEANVYGVLDIDTPTYESGEDVDEKEEEFGFCLTGRGREDEWERLQNDWETAIGARQSR